MKLNFLNKINPQNLRDFSDQYGKNQFPESIPLYIWFIKLLCSLAKLSLPLILQRSYQYLQNVHQSSNHTPFYQISLSIIGMVIFSFGIQLYFQERLIQYRLNIKQILSKRILSNNIQSFEKQKQNLHFSSHHDRDKIKIYSKITMKLPVYIYNYYNSLLCLIFQIFNISFAIFYLSTKLSYSLIVALLLAFCIMVKIISVTQKMQKYTFDNMALQQQKIAYLKAFFKKLVQYKMTFLDKWIHDKVSQNQVKYQENLQGNKLLDCWCVGLWRFTIISISSVIFCSYYFFDIEGKTSSSSRGEITPSTILYFIMIMTSPLNGLSWNVAGIKNAKKAINQILNDIKIPNKDIKICSVNKSIRIVKRQNQTQVLHIDDQTKMKITKSHHQYQNNSNLQLSEDAKANFVQIIIPYSNFQFGSIISIREYEDYNILNNLPYLLKNTIPQVQTIGYAQQNGWFLDNVLDSITLLSTQVNYQQISDLLDAFKCEGIPLQNSTSTYSGGQKIRISLVRAFLNSKIIFIDSDLNSLDKNMKNQVLQSIRYICKKDSKLVFIKDNEQSANYVLKFTTTKELVQIKQVIGVLQQLNFKYPQNIKQNKKIDIKVKQTYEQLKRNLFKNNSQNSLSSLQQADINNAQKQKYYVNMKTFKAYYKSYKHLIFIISIIFVTILQNFYNFYVANWISFQTLSRTNIIQIIILTTLFGVCVLIRSYYFAVANLQQSKRISKDVNQCVIMNQIQFYLNYHPQTDKDKTFVENKNTPAKQPNYQQFCSKLIYNATTDLHQTSDTYPWHANIYFNNVATIASSILMITYQIPLVVFLLVPLVIYTFNLNKKYQLDMQKLMKKQKLIQQRFMKHMNRIQSGIKYLYIYGQKVKKVFIGNFEVQLRQSLQTQWKLHKLKHNVNLLYRILMVLFISFIIFLYWSTIFTTGYSVQINKQFHNFTTQNSFRQYLQNNSIYFKQNQHKSQSGQFALLISYTMTLTNFMLFFTISMGQTLQQAHSIERIRSFIFQDQNNQNKKFTKQRFNHIQAYLQKVKTSINSRAELPKLECIIQLNNFSFIYPMNNVKVFNNLNLKINRGDKIQLKGQSGSGKTTFFKILLSLYKQQFKKQNDKLCISFSPQHPIMLPFTSSVKQNIDPYALMDWSEYKCFQQFIKQLNLPGKYQKQIINSKAPQSLTYESQIVIGNIRAYLYGKKGLKIYDEPFWIGPENIIKGKLGQQETYIIVTHHRQFYHNRQLVLQNQKVIEAQS